MQHPYHNLELETARLRLRSPKLSDVPYWQKNLNDWEVVKHMTSSIKHPLTEDDVVSYLTKILWPLVDTGNAISFVIERKEEDGSYTFMGNMSYERDNADAELGRGFWLGRNYHGYGYMTEAATAADDFVFKTMEVPAIYTRSAVDNIASAKVKEKQGWERISKSIGKYKIGEIEEYKWKLENPYV